MSSRRFFRRKQSDVELQQEIDLYLAEEIAENVERGMPADEARRQAYLKLGSPRRVREEVWRHYSFSTVESFWRDMRQVLRRLERSPSVVLTVMVSLGLQSTVFSECSNFPELDLSLGRFPVSPSPRTLSLSALAILRQLSTAAVRNCGCERSVTDHMSHCGSTFDLYAPLVSGHPCSAVGDLRKARWGGSRAGYLLIGFPITAQSRRYPRSTSRI